MQVQKYFEKSSNQYFKFRKEDDKNIEIDCQKSVAVSSQRREERALHETGACSQSKAPLQTSEQVITCESYQCPFKITRQCDKPSGASGLQVALAENGFYRQIFNIKPI